MPCRPALLAWARQVAGAQLASYVLCLLVRTSPDPADSGCRWSLASDHTPLWHLGVQEEHILCRTRNWRVFLDAVVIQQLRIEGVPVIRVLSLLLSALLGHT